MVALGSNASRPDQQVGEEEAVLRAQKYGDDEQRRAATQVSPARRVAAAMGHLRRHSSSPYRSLLIRLRRRSSHLAHWRAQRGSREVVKGALTAYNSFLV